MKNLRKLAKAIKGHKYEVECITLLANNETTYCVKEIKINKTKLRSLEGIHYEALNGENEWEPILEETYFRVINEHIHPVPLEIKADDIFLVKDHFEKRFKERFNFLLNNDTFTPLDFIFQNGYVFNENLTDDMISNNTYYLYEPMSRFLVIAQNQGNKIALITTYDPSDRNAFKWTLETTGLANAPKLSDYVHETFEKVEV